MNTMNSNNDLYQRALQKSAAKRLAQRKAGTMPPLRNCVVCDKKVPYTGNRDVSKLASDDVIMWLGQEYLRRDFHYGCIKKHTIEGAILQRTEQLDESAARKSTIHINNDVRSIIEGNGYALMSSLQRIRNLKHRYIYLCKLLHFVEPGTKFVNAHCETLTLVTWNFLERETSVYRNVHKVDLNSTTTTYLSRHNIATWIEVLFTR